MGRVVWVFTKVRVYTPWSWYWWLPSTRSSWQLLTVAGRSCSRYLCSESSKPRPNPISPCSVANSQNMADACGLVGTWTDTVSPGARVSGPLLPGPKEARSSAMKFLAVLGLHHNAAGASTVCTTTFSPCFCCCCCLLENTGEEAGGLEEEAEIEAEGLYSPDSESTPTA